MKIIGLLFVVLMLGCASTHKPQPRQPPIEDKQEQKATPPTPQPANDTPKFLTISKNEWMVHIPSSFQDVSSQYPDMDMVWQSETNKTVLTFLSSSLGENDTLESYTDEFMKSVVSKGALPLDQREGEIDGVPANLLILGAPIPPQIFMLHFIFVKGDKIFNFDCALDGQPNKPVVQQCFEIAKSIKINSTTNSSN